ncbi:MAG: sulfur carrier protein ThiS [Deferrisomatales bacterium]|nr:sulfur carrier protein ThiS [Deferrisomatales bacterium]
MRIAVNGVEREAAPGLTVLELLRELRLDPEAVVVERNGEVAARRDLGRMTLQEGDRLELVRFVGGG